MRSDSLESTFFFRIKHRPFFWTNKASFNNRLSKSLNLSDSKQSAKISQQGFNRLFGLSVDGLDELVKGEVDSMKLGKLVQPDSDLEVDNIFFGQLLSFVGNLPSNNVENMVDGFNKEISHFL